MPEPLLPCLQLGAASAAKAAHYQEVVGAIQAVLQDEPNWVAAMATVSSMLHQAFACYHWTGFYCVWPQDDPCTLVVGPYQGSLGCRRIAFGRGVCGTAAATRQTQLVPDVHAFPGHIACAGSTQSEVVVPLVVPRTNEVLGVLDIDSDDPAAFDGVDAAQLESLCRWLATKYGGAVTHSAGGGVAEAAVVEG